MLIIFPTKFGVKRAEPCNGSVGGPERPSTLHRLSGDAEERFLDSFPRIDSVDSEKNEK